MGYKIKIEDVNTLQEKYPAIKELRDFSNLLWFELQMLYSRRNDQASLEECKAACMIAFQEAKLHLVTSQKIYINPRDPKKIVIGVGKDQNGINIELTGMAPDGKYVCSACGLQTPDRLTGAHNVIPSSAWKHIIGNALIEFSKEFTKVKHPQNRPDITAEQLLELGTRLTRAGRSTKFEASELKKRNWHQQDMRVLFTMLACGEDEDSRGATTYEGGQCKSCEALHNNMSLIQRVYFVMHNSEPGRSSSVMVSSALSGAKPSVESAIEHTRRVFELVVNDMSACLIQLKDKSPLAGLILTNDEMFVQTLWAYTRAVCCAKRGDSEDKNDQERYVTYVKTGKV